jgi:hypothetical protein
MKESIKVTDAAKLETGAIISVFDGPLASETPWTVQRVLRFKSVGAKFYESVSFVVRAPIDGYIQDVWVNSAHVEWAVGIGPDGEQDGFWIDGKLSGVN